MLWLALAIYYKPLIVGCLIYASGGILDRHEQWLQIGEKASTGDHSPPKAKGEHGGNFGGSRNGNVLVPVGDRSKGTSLDHRGVQAGHGPAMSSNLRRKAGFRPALIGQ